MDNVCRCFAVATLCVLGIGVGGYARADNAPPAAPVTAPAAGEPKASAAPATEAEATCDRLAAAPVPLSPQARHPDEIDWQQAITACTQAIKEDPKQPRYEYELGHAYEQTKNYAEALTHYKAAADGGSGDGLQAAGFLYYKGLGTVVDKEKAFVLWYRATEAGNAQALANLGAMFGNGEFVQRDDAKMLEYFAKSVAAGNAAALGQVGVAFVWGRGDPVDYKMAASYFQQSADLGDGFSLKYLAILYERGLLGPPDKFKATQLRQKAQEVDPNSQDPTLPPALTASRGGGGGTGGGGGVRTGGGVVGGQGVIDPNGPRHGVVATWRDPNANQQFYHGEVQGAPTWHGIATALPHCWPMCTVKY
jgi:tetratricopeptide (TPR) repeat protein